MELIIGEAAQAPLATENAASLLDLIRVERTGEEPLAALDPTTYARDHAEFESLSDQRRLIISCLLDHLNARTTPATDPVAVLSVGCGDGSVDVALAEALVTGESSRSVRYVGVEPFEGSAAEFARRMSDLELADLDAAVHVATFEEALAGELLNERFDLITFVHSMYYVHDVAAAVRAAYDLLKPGGELLVLSAPRGVLNQLASVLAPPVDGHRQWFSDDVSAGFGEAGFDTAAARTLNANVDLTDASHEVLDFTVQARITDDLLPLVSRYLAEVAVGPDALVIPHPVDVYRVERPR